jgi:hypothetical protein
MWLMHRLTKNTVDKKAEVSLLQRHAYLHARSVLLCLASRMACSVYIRTVQPIKFDLHEGVSSWQNPDSGFLRRVG